MNTTPDPPTIRTVLHQLYQQWSGSPPHTYQPLPPAGSHRQYFRLRGPAGSAIGTYGSEAPENRAFLAFSQHFHRLNLPVPQLYAQDPSGHYYLQQDLGDTALYTLLPPPGTPFSPALINHYQTAVRQLAQLQIRGAVGLDYSLCYPRDRFDLQSIRWDFNTFKYYFLKLLQIPFDEQALENDLERFAAYLLEADGPYFMFRDFQSRNIMIHHERVYFIDYQGGRRGALQYDLASLLYQAKAQIPADLRAQLVDTYLAEAQTLISLDRDRFIAHFHAFALVRCIQVLGTYGLRGLYERKSHFLASIPFALRNLQDLLQRVRIDPPLDELWTALRRVTERTAEFERQALRQSSESPLTVYVSSFSYKYGAPEDPSGNGGGFIFDCRCLHNPGRYQPYQTLTGLDRPVIEFLEARSNIQSFLQNAWMLVDEAVQNYLERGFSSLMVSFGCTGGQHRSVYAAERTMAYLRERYGLRVELRHWESTEERDHWKKA
ncbi:MAG: RNase adapter RapZ [Bacteroidota bacterium]